MYVYIYIYIYTYTYTSIHICIHIHIHSYKVCVLASPYVSMYIHMRVRPIAHGMPFVQSQLSLINESPNAIDCVYISMNL